MSRETFIDSGELHGGPLAHNHPPYDFTDLPPALSLELRLLLQSRLDANRTMLRRHEYQHIRKQALNAKMNSLLEGTETLTDCIYMSNTPVPPCFTASSNAVKAHVRFAIAVAAEIGWPLDLMDRDRWYEHDYGRENARVKTLSFAGFESHWVKQWAKQFIHYELTIGKAWSTAISYGCRFLPFARFVARNHPEMRGPQDVNRKFLLEYIGWINRQPNVAASQRQALASAVRVLLEEHRVNEWTPHIPETAVIRQGELPKRAEALPRPIDERVLRQIFNPTNLILASPQLGLLLHLLDAHGFRAGTVVSLEIDCLTEDADGFPALRYWNRKRTRERLHPVRDPQLPDLIREQQHRARTQHPNTTYLFPKKVANVAANQHYPVSTLQVAFAAYLKQAGV
uniref:hypothetical protein n=1 Tax=Arthrobacter sp. H14 TaxID=1312959 RepID=UPI00138AB012